MIIDGAAIAKKNIVFLKKEFASQRERKFLGALLVGDDPASLRFLKQKEKTAKEIGVDFRLYQYPSHTTTDELRKEIGRLAAPARCGGFIVQLPLPKHIRRRYVLNAIPQEKDIDVLSERSFAAFCIGQSKITPPSVGTVKEIIEVMNFSLPASQVAVIGKGILVGTPVAAWLEKKAGCLTVFDSKTFTPTELKEMDLVVSGAGRSGLFSAKHLKPGTLVIDFGTEHKEGKIFGDFDAHDAERFRISYTKTPGGTGPILVAKLFENFYDLNKINSK